MVTLTTSLEGRTRMEDALAHFPVSGTTAYRKHELIYGPEAKSKSIHLVVKGKVAVSRIAGNGSEVLLEILGPDDLFGESAFLDDSRCSERATAIESAIVMSWTVVEMESLIATRPRLAVSLLQFVVQRRAAFADRIESLARDTIENRLARGLIRLSERLGTAQGDGSTFMMPLTHQMLSRYVGTSREVVTMYMSRFRQRGYVSYSRRGIQLWSDALTASLRGGGGAPPRANGQASRLLA